jgi:hypothetical protein
MRRTIFTLIVAMFLGIGSAFAQEPGAGAGRVEIGAFPGGGMFFTKSTDATQLDFGNYALGASLTVNFNKWIGAEGELGGGIGVKQNLTFNGAMLASQKTPSMLAYNGNLVLNPTGSDRAVVPYVTGGIGGLTIFQSDQVAALGVTADETYLTGNVGGGVKWFSTRHFGVRADYRFIAIKSNDTAPAFFGQRETRYGHRIYGGLVLTY